MEVVICKVGWRCGARRDVARTARRIVLLRMSKMRQGDQCDDAQVARRCMEESNHRRWKVRRLGLAQIPADKTSTSGSSGCEVSGILQDSNEGRRARIIRREQ